MTVAPPDHARTAYDAFAPAYDRFTAHHDQEGWTGLVLGLAVDAGLRGKRVLEVGCGTGSAMLPMLERGYDVTGADISPQMVERARDKVDGRSDVVVADARRLPELGHFDLVWAVCDSVGYLLTDEDLAAAFSGMRRNLAPGGVVAFDVGALGGLRRFYSSLAVVGGADEVVVWRGTAPGDLPPGGSVAARVEHLYRSGDGWREAVSVHRQRHHGEHVLRRALRAAGLECVSVHGVDAAGAVQVPFVDDQHNKAVYIARASASGGEGR